MKTYRCGIMLQKQVECINNGICIAKQSNHTSSFFISDRSEIMRCHLLILLYQSLGHHKFLHSILARILKHLLASKLRHCIAHLKRRIHHNAVVTIKHLGIHSAHRCAYYQVGLFFLAHLSQHLNSLLWMKRDITSHNSCVGQQSAQHCHCTRLCRRTKTVYIHYLLARHEVGILLYILILYFHIQLI